MTTSAFHDHTAGPDGIDPADLDLYALDALPPEEARAVERALTSAPAPERNSMLRQVAATREVAAGLVAQAGVDVPPPPGLRVRVLSGIAEPPAAGPTGSAAVTDLGDVRARRRRGWITGLASVAAAVALVSGGVAIGRLTADPAPRDTPVAASASGQMPPVVKRLLATPDLSVAQAPVGGRGSATLLASRSADMAMISMIDLPDPRAGSAYQLWLMGPDHPPIPSGTMESGRVGPTASAALEGIGGSTEVAVTVEPAGGSPAPTGPVVLALELA